MIETLPLPASVRTHYGLALFAVATTIGLSGCSQASQLLVKNHFASRATVAEASITDQHAGSLEFDVSQEMVSAQQSKFHLTNFKQSTNTDNDARSFDSTVEVLPPPPPIDSQTIPVSMHQHQHQLTQVVAPQKVLTTLAAGESLDSKLKNAPGIVIVDFYADWCGPCRRQGSILHSMEAEAVQNHATIIKVNIEQHRQLAAKYNVSSLPTLIAVKDGNVLRRQIGLINESKVAALMQL